MAKDVIVTASKVKKWHSFGKKLKLSVLLLLLFLIVIYIVLLFNMSEGSFYVNIKNNGELESGMAIYESQKDPTPKRKISADSLQFMDNISIKWLPENIQNEAEGSHNGDNYIAYTFFIENQGSDIFNYWYEVSLDDVIKNVDEAIRIMVFINDDKTLYAKANSVNGNPEDGTVSFLNREDNIIILEQRKNMIPGDIDRFTVVIWIEGDDPDCVDALLGGQLKMHMNVTEEHINT